jgi:preprotein translocase subunit SecG
MNPILFDWVFPTIHVLACFFLIVVVLLQTGKGADVGAVFGGSSQTLFGSTGAGNFLTKLTTGMAFTFMATSLLIAIGQRQTPASGLIDRLPAAEAPAPIDLPPAGGPAAAIDPPPAPAESGQANAGADAVPPPVAPAAPPAEAPAAP